MPAGERRQAGRLSRWGAAQAASLVLLLVAGCLDLALPDVPSTPPKPSLSVDTPRAGDTIALTAQVTATAASVNGISSVAVLCGPLDGGARTVFTWNAPPYQAFVNFGLCQDVAIANPDGGPLPLLQLEVVALTDAGATQEVGFNVSLNLNGPSLSVQFPPTAQPKASFTVTVTSDQPLRSFPGVTLDGAPASSVTPEANPDGGPPTTFLAFFASTPGLGTDNAPYTPGVPVPIEVLTDTDRTVRLTVTGTGLNGNMTEMDLGVELSRVVWDRFIPGQPALDSPTQWAAEPLAFAGGLLLPLATTTPAGADSNWLPGLFLPADGTFVGFDTSKLPGGADGGYLATGLNGKGDTLFVQAQGRFSGLWLAPPPPQVGPLATQRVPGTPTAPLSRVDDLLCLQDSVTACSTQTVESLTCFDPTLALVTATSGLVSTGPPTVGVVAGGGGRYLSPNVGVCGNSWNLVDLDAGTVSFGPLQDPNLPTCNVVGISKLLAVGDGTFVVQLQSACILTNAGPPRFSILRVGEDSTILGAYTSPLGTPSGLFHEVVGVLADGRLVTLRNAPPYTVFELWTLNSATPDVTSPISGLFDSADAVLDSVLAQSSFSGADGSFAVLLSGDTNFGAAIAAFGPQLQPRWLYLYPRIANATSTRLVSAASVPDVYLVDDINNHAVSVRVVPEVAPPPPPDAGPPDAGSPDGGGGPSPYAGIYVAQSNTDTVLVFALDASGDTAPVRTISGTQTGLSVPIGVVVDSKGNLYVANRNASTVTVYAPLANGNVAPLRTLTAEGMGAPEALALSVGDDLFVATCPTCGESPGGDTAVFHFPAQSSTSDFEIVGDNTGLTAPTGVALGDVVPATGGQPLYVANAFSGNIYTFAPGATGDAMYVSFFQPTADTDLQGMAYGKSTLFFSDPSQGVTLFPASATGQLSYSSSLTPPGFEFPGGVAVDVTVNPPTVYLADWEIDSLYVITTTGVLPNLAVNNIVTISGGTTGLSEPLGVWVVR
jgi:NHL repeat